MDNEGSMWTICGALWCTRCMWYRIAYIYPCDSVLGKWMREQYEWWARLYSRCDYWQWKSGR